MKGFGLRVPFVCFVALGLAACAEAETSPDRPASDGSLDRPGVQGGIDGDELSGAPDGSSGGSDIDIGIDDDIDDDDTEDGPGTPGGANCTCGIQVPGVTIGSEDGGVQVIVELPGVGEVVLGTGTGDVTTGNAGVDIRGDVELDLGQGALIELADADLHLDTSGGAPVLSGDAGIGGALLGSLIGGGAHDILRADVGLGLNVALPDGSSGPALELGLELPELSLDTACLPASVGVMTLADAVVTIATDGVQRGVTINGDVDAGAEVWTSLVPLAATGALDATVRAANDDLLDVTLSGDVDIVSGELLSGDLALLGAMADAVVTLDRSGAGLDAKADATLNSAIGIDGWAFVSARFEPQQWWLRICARAAVTLFGQADAGPRRCVMLTPDGPEHCEEPDGPREY